MNKLKRNKKQIDTYKQFKRELFWKNVWTITKKVLFWSGLVLFFLYYAIFYFFKLCLNDK